MAKRTNILDDMSLRAAVKRAKLDKRTARFNDGGGLICVVTAAGRARFLHRYSYQGVWATRWFPGEYPSGISLAEARVKVAEDRLLLDDGVNPADASGATSARPTLAEYARANFRLLAPAFERDLDPSKTQWMRDIERRTGKLGKMEIDKIKVTDVVANLGHYWVDHTPRPTARHLCERLARILRHRHANTRPNDTHWQNPADFGILKDILGARAHHSVSRASLAFEDVPAFLLAVRDKPTMSSRCLEWIVLSGCRPGEAAGARWGEIDWKARVWIIPPERLKTERGKGPKGKPFAVPLSLMMVQLLRRTAGIRIDLGPDDLIFPSDWTRRGPDARQYGTRAMLGHAQAINPAITSHGFRSTITAWGIHMPHRKQPPFSLEVMDRVLGHIIGAKRDGDGREHLSQALGAYAKHAWQDPFLGRRKIVMREWSAYLRAAMNPPAPAVAADAAPKLRLVA